MIEKRDPLDLKPHKLNREIYGKEAVDKDLVKSINEIGLLQELVIKNDGTVISGHRRLKAVLFLGPEKINSVSCKIVSFDNKMEEKKALISYNLYREKTQPQLAAEGKILEEIYAEEAEKRMKAGKKQDSSAPDQTDPVLKSSTWSMNEIKNQPGRTRAKVAKELQMGEETYRRLTKVREASESEDPVLQEIGSRLMNDPMKINPKFNLLRSFEKIYKAFDNENIKIKDYAQGLVVDIQSKLIKIEDAHQELINFTVALKKKEKALKDAYPSDDYEGPEEYIDNEEGIKRKKELNSIIHAKPADDTVKPIFDTKPRVSPKYQVLLDAVKDANTEISYIASVLKENVDNDDMTIDEAYHALESKISEIEARESMKDIPEEPGETLEKTEVKTDAPGTHTPESLEVATDSPENNYPDHDFCKKCKEGPVIGLGGIDADIKILMQASLEAAKYNGNWKMEYHMLLNKVLVELQSSNS